MGIHSPVAQNKYHILGQVRDYQSGSTYEMSEDRTTAGNRPEEQLVAGIPYDRLYNRSQRSMHLGYSFPSSWPGAGSHVIQCIVHWCSSITSLLILISWASTLVGPFPWMMTGKVSCIKFLARTLPSSNFSTTSSANTHTHKNCQFYFPMRLGHPSQEVLPLWICKQYAVLKVY